MKLIRKNSSLANNEHGATIVEFALVFALFLFIVLTFIDFARFFATKALLIHGAQRGLDLAQKIDGIEIDTTLPGADIAKFRNARTAVITTANEIVLRTLGRDDVAEPNAAIRVRHYTPIDFVGTAYQERATQMGALLRPGDSAKFPDNQIFHHVSKCSSHFGAGCPNHRLPNETMEKLLQDFPLMVQLEAVVETYSPWMGDLIPRETAMGWRELRVKAGFQAGNFVPGSPPPSTPPPPVGGGSSCPPGVPYSNGCCGCGGEI